METMYSGWYWDDFDDYGTTYGDYDDDYMGMDEIGRNHFEYYNVASAYDSYGY